ncbi:MAG TPA: T9SS type A sorting domain-containing protein [Chryseosolibacter sp.]|nr:T9SS type A sorting domain-containing protein [Chryseosolibacter sp.]
MMKHQVLKIAWFFAFAINAAFAQSVNKVEYFIDGPDPGHGGGTNVTISPSADISQSFSVPVSSLSTGFHILNVRARQDGDSWSLTQAMPFFVVDDATTNLAYIEYFIDSDPGYGSATSVPFTPSSDVTTSFAVDLTGATTGLHILNVRTKSTSGKWSRVHAAPFYIASNTSTNITDMEYWIDTDPGTGNGTPISFTTSADVNTAVSLNTTGLTGLHVFNVRVKDAADQWSLAYSRPFYVASNIASDIAAMEYYVDTDPGFGAATQVSITPGADVTTSFVVNTAALTNGLHILNVRTQDLDGTWSIAQSKPFYLINGGVSNIVRLEYFVDTDPGYGLATEIPTSAGPDVEVAYSVSSSGLSNGLHILNLRAKDENNNWGQTQSSPFYLINGVASNITEIEYFVDADPGVGQATAVSFTPGADVTEAIFVDAESLSPGLHVFSVRMKDEFNSWSLVNSLPFVISKGVNNIIGFEYSFDADPGVGNGTFVATGTPAADINEVFNIDISALSQGNHKLFVRMIDAQNVWGMTEVVDFFACGISAPVAVDATTITDESFKASWNPVSGISTYRLDVSTDNFGTFVTGYEDKTLSDTLDIVSGLQPLTSYQYRVRAEGVCTSDNSNVVTLTTLDILNIITDSLNLVTLYDNTNGESWASSNGWLTGDLATWFGITIANDRVTGIALPDNNIAGSVPSEVASMNALETVDLSGNEISALPDLSAISTLSSLDVSDNQLQFESLEPNIGISGFVYDNQAVVGTASTVEVYGQTSHELIALVAGANNIFTWKRNGASIQQSSANSYTITSLTRADVGSYMAEVSNSVVPNLTITTAPIDVVGVADIEGRLMISSTQAANAGDITLLRVMQSDGYDTVATTTVNNEGQFLFEAAPLYDYQLLGLADRTEYPLALPTYYTNTLYWEEADTIFLEADTSGFDIVTQMEPPQPPQGAGLIMGVLYEDDGTGEGGRTKAKKRVAGAGVSARRVEGSGRGQEELTLVDYQFTNDQGEFFFTELPEGTFRLNVQYPGYPMDETSDIDVVVGTALESEKNVEATVEEGKIIVRELIITDITKDSRYAVDMYPNPASEIVTIEFIKVSDHRATTITDMQGRTLFKKETGAIKHEFNVGSLAKGVYVITVEENGRIVKRKQLTIN